MPRKDRIDLPGALMLVLFAMFFALNQVVIKWVNGGLQPVFFAGIRSLGAVVCVWAWMRMNGRPLRVEPGTVWAGLAIGVAFTAEFLLLFLALDLTTVVRSAVLFYSMPVWLALMAHFFLPGERMGGVRVLGLVMAFAGVTWAIANRGDGGGHGSVLGDLCALGGAIGWAATAFLARGSAMVRVRPEMQLFWMVLVSGVVLTAVSPFFGPLVRDFQPLHWVGLIFQIVMVVTAGFLLWLWLLSVYPPSGVASFSFLTPVFGIGFGWLLLGEQTGLGVLGAGVLVCVGLILINRPARQVPPSGTAA
jgi:drug/metabolite transporter (DMT)-like permease